MLGASRTVVCGADVCGVAVHLDVTVTLLAPDPICCRPLAYAPAHMHKGARAPDHLSPPIGTLCPMIYAQEQIRLQWASAARHCGIEKRRGWHTHQVGCTGGQRRSAPYWPP